MAKSTNSALPKEIVVQSQRTVSMVKVSSPKGIKFTLNFDGDDNVSDIHGAERLPGDLEDPYQFFNDVLDMNEDEFRDFVQCLASVRAECARIKALKTNQQ